MLALKPELLDCCINSPHVGFAALLVSIQWFFKFIFFLKPMFSISPDWLYFPSWFLKQMKPTRSHYLNSLLLPMDFSPVSLFNQIWLWLQVWWPRWLGWAGSCQCLWRRRGCCAGFLPKVTNASGGEGEIGGGKQKNISNSKAGEKFSQSCFLVTIRSLLIPLYLFCVKIKAQM